ncbi:MAG: glycosyltransferase [Dehalococcoidia bacterium]
MRTDVGRDFELDVVTRDPVQQAGNVRVHRLESHDAKFRELFATADIFVMPSLAECFGLATVEAMASGLPVIVSNRGGAQDIVEPGRTGLLIEPNRDDLAAALRAMAANREQLPRYGREGRAVAESRFDSSANDGRILQLMEDLAFEFTNSLRSQSVRPAGNDRD